ncbi:hypothetical protein PTTG_03796 [Puccinia triticina 1-1 BBBD Race 1]|uniref:DASH complex subunit DUO1 n=1 Tax=Puccinia triticina (isolate 1-1 / race 1 (BBBD)) TaxID=630390 RepID=A0A0C4ESL7_PUCT1|nr:hypothetical protein PTTG_03796 [Puccinia triticina 1-1 BBBD Race 1]
MPNNHHIPKGAAGKWNDDADILNDSISMNMDDDSFDGNESTLILPSNPAGPSSSNNPRSIPAGSSQSVPSGSKNPFNPHPFSSPPEKEEQEEEEGPSRRKPNKSSKDEWIRRETERNRELENERDWLREINQLLEKSADEMENIKEKLGNFQSATETSHELLDLYSKILTQTEHTKDLLSNPNWEGLTADIKRRTEIRQAEKIRRAEEREREREEELIRERKQQQLEAEAAAEAARKQSQLHRFTRGSSSATRGRGAGTSAGRTARGKSRIGRMTR